MKKIYIIITITENNKHYSWLETIKTGQNLLNYFERYKAAVCFHLCETKKQAEETTQYWNECYKRNGTYLFDSPAF